MKLFIFLILLLNIINSNSTTVTFNNQVISNCIISKPCDLSSNAVWEDNEIPTNGDDIVIDFSSVTSGSDIYLTVSNLHLQLNSFTLTGQQSNQPNSNLVISNSNLTVSTFEVNYSNVTFLDNLNHKIVLDSLSSTLSNVVTNGTVNMNIGTFNGNGGNLNIAGQSQVTINGNANVNLQVFHTSDYLGFLGLTTISTSFYSFGVTEFNNDTTFSASSLLNVTFVNTKLTIKNGATLQTYQYNQLSKASSIIVMEGSALAIILPIVQYSTIVNSIALYNASTLYVPSGFMYSNTYAQANTMNGTIVIGDSNFVTFFSSVNQKALSVQTPGNITMESTTLGYLQMQNTSSLLQIRTEVILNKFTILGTVDIYITGSLTTVNPSNAATINVMGTLTIGGELSGNAIFIDPQGLVYGYDRITSAIYSLTGSTSLGNGVTLVQTVDIQQQASLYVYPSNIKVSGNLIIGGNSTIVFGSVNLNKKVEYLQVLGNVQIDSSTSLVVIIEDSAVPVNGDKILLITSNSLLNNGFANFDQSKIKAELKTGEVITDLKYMVEIDDAGNLSLVFSTPETDSGLSTKVKIGIAIGCVFGAVGLIIFIIVIVKRRNRHHHHHHHHRHHENSPLIH